MSHWTATEGTPYPLGATWIEEEDAYNFALYSRHAESVTLLLYGSPGAREEREVAAELGGAWDVYAAATPRWVPRFGRRVGARTPYAEGQALTPQQGARCRVGGHM